MYRKPGEGWRDGRRGAGARVPFGLAWVACLLCAGLAAGALLLAVLNGHGRFDILIDDNTVVVMILTLAFSVVGALMASHRPGNAIGWIFLAVGFFQGLANFGYEYATYALLTRSRSIPLGANLLGLVDETVRPAHAALWPRSAGRKETKNVG